VNAAPFCIFSHNYHCCIIAYCFQEFESDESERCSDLTWEMESRYSRYVATNGRADFEADLAVDTDFATDFSNPSWLDQVCRRSEFRFYYLSLYDRIWHLFWQNVYIHLIICRKHAWNLSLGNRLRAHCRCYSLPCLGFRCYSHPCPFLWHSWR